MWTHQIADPLARYVCKMIIINFGLVLLLRVRIFFSKLLAYICFVTKFSFYFRYNMVLSIMAQFPFITFILYIAILLISVLSSPKHFVALYSKCVNKPFHVFLAERRHRYFLHNVHVCTCTRMQQKILQFSDLA